MFKWDGTDVTDIITQSDIFEAKYNKLNYWVIQIKTPNTIQSQETTITETTITCIVRSGKNLPCLIDELKPVFGLQKLGTHWCKHGGKIYVLIRCIMTEEGYIKEETTLNMVTEVTPLLKLQIQEIFAFRELLGVTCSYESSIIIREKKNNTYPISFYEPNMATVDTKVIPFNVLDKWFEDSSIDEVVKRLCRIHTIDRIGTVLHNIRSQIDEIVERVDRRTISYKSCIMNRITERLQTTLG